MTEKLPLPEYETLSIAETLRIMDVATEIRKQQELVETAFHAEELKDKLRDKLIATAEVTGEEITEEQIQKAIDWYFLHLHKYKHPKRSWSLFLAHLYIRRGCFLGFGLFAVALISSAYGIYHLFHWALSYFSY